MPSLRFVDIMASAIGLFIYVSLLLVNAIAILNEERFLARGKSLYAVTSSPRKGKAINLSPTDHLLGFLSFFSSQLDGLLASQHPPLILPVLVVKVKRQVSR